MCRIPLGSGGNRVRTCAQPTQTHHPHSLAVNSRVRDVAAQRPFYRNFQNAIGVGCGGNNPLTWPWTCLKCASKWALVLGVVTYPADVSLPPTLCRRMAAPWSATDKTGSSAAAAAPLPLAAAVLGSFTFFTLVGLALSASVRGPRYRSIYRGHATTPLLLGNPMHRRRGAVIRAVPPGIG